METAQELQKQLEELRTTYKGVLSLLLMMEKGTKLEDLRKIESEKLDPIRKEIKALETLLTDASKRPTSEV